MEAKLFWISIACGAYSLLLRLFLRRESRAGQWKLTAVMHGLFWALVGIVAGSLLSSYWERPDLSIKLMVGLGLIGSAWGVLWRFFRPRDAETSLLMMADDLEWSDTGFSAILLAAFIMYFFVQAFKIPSGSMRMTLLEGDHLFVNKFIYGTRIPLTSKKIWRFRKIQRGDVVVFRFPTEDKENPHYGKDFIKRAIGLPGDVIEIRKKVVYVNGQPLSESYVNFDDSYVIPPLRPYPSAEEFQKYWQEGTLAQSAGEMVRDHFGPITIPQGYYFVMGDNRDRSFDARFWGPLPDQYVKGRAWFLYLPMKRIKLIR
ncbi:MAG TPA: signal peptidase I [Elusimicrobiota bacterium]|nr:signal peptidase I [Elusimicrobiota bacterium]